MHKRKYSLEELASDNSFIDWCLEPNEEISNYWEGWIAENPDKIEDIEKAKALVLGLQKSQKINVNADIQAEAWDQISTHIKKPAAIKSLYRNHLGKIAAILVLGLLSFYFLFQQGEGLGKAEWVIHENTTSSNEIILLADNTKIELSPSSKIEYMSAFVPESREVILEGEAFFDVTKDTSRPFLIYTNETITKVLGTSFFVRAYAEDEEVEVDVKTGIVEVYAHVSESNGEVLHPMLVTNQRISIPKLNKKITITPNQRVLVDKQNDKMVKRITEKPKLLNDINTQLQQTFKNAPLAKVFDALEKAYGLEIQFDRKRLSSCTISTKLSDEPLKTKLALICDALDLTLVEEDAIIKIGGNACKG